MKGQGYFSRVQAMTATRFWINNVTRKEAELAIAAGAEGCTQNPSYPWKMLSSDDDGGLAHEMVEGLVSGIVDDDAVLVTLQRELVREIARKFLALHESSGGKRGYVSVQGDPFHEDFDTIVRLARFNREAGKNIMVKIPATEDGLKAMGTCLAEGMPINATEIMSLRQAVDVCDIYDEVTLGMKNPPVVFLSHIAGIFDEYIAKTVKESGTDIPADHLYMAGFVMAQRIRAMMDERKSPVGFINGGARGLNHFTEWVGGNLCSTINWKGCADKLLEQDPPVVSRFSNPVPAAVVESLLELVPDFRKAWFKNGIQPSEYEKFGPVVLFRTSFENAWNQALGLVRARRAEMAASK
jgi:transaldolase